MRRIDVEQNWNMKMLPDGVSVAATVPGSVYNDLINAGLLDDPYWRDNEDSALQIMNNDFEYTGTISVDMSAADESDEVLLRFEGLDTLADVSFNGNELGSTDNMHRCWNYSVKDFLRDGSNEIRIIFHSPIKYIKEQYEKDPAILGTEDAMRGFPKIRKGHYMFGWDWGPRIPDAGIWKPVTMPAVNKAELKRVYIRQKFNDDMSSVALSVETAYRYAKETTEHVITTDSDSLCTGMHIRVTVYDPQSKVLPGLVVMRPQLWWPNGYGEQPLYTIVTELLDENDVVLDTVTKRIGLRRLEQSTIKDEYGNEFAHVVNGVKIFAMGADYIPEDNILARTGYDRTLELLTQCKAAHFNCIRVWGGGLYPSDDFYDICDELGLLVWQDFMFACANYRLTRAFEDNIMAELKDQIRRLSHHASLGLWCGNNEMEMFVDQGEWGAKNEIKSDYVKMYEYLFPRLLEEEDPDRFYWPASPSSGGGFDYPNDPNRGDVHYWDVWHGNKPFTEYRKFYFRYLSEFGFQSFPSLKTIESFTKEEDRNVFSYVMEKHQRNASANGKIMNYMEQTFLYPNSLDVLVYASQLLQAEAIRYGVEHFRRNRGRCMGTVYWQLNDCWPVASWSSIDYFGRWKALHYYAKRFFAPLMISCEEEGVLTQSMNVNAEPYEVKKSIRLNVANERRSDCLVTVKWQLRKSDGSIICDNTQELAVPALTSVWMDKVELNEAGLYDNYVSYQLLEGDSIVSEGTVLFCAPKHFRFEDPGLQVGFENGEIVVSAEKYAKSVEISNDNDDLILSDNYFDLNGGTKRVKVIKGSADNLRVRSVYSIR